MAHVIVIGAGLGGIPAAFDLRKHLAKSHRVTLIGARPYFEFTPSNPWIAVGWRTAKETQVPMQTPLDKKGVDWLVNTVTQIDAEHSKLTLDDGKELSYDYLVIATGPRLAFEEVPGLGPDGFTQSVCSQDHSMQAWTRYQEFLKNPGPIIIGAAPGASCFGPAYETAMVIDADLRKRKLRDRVPMTYVTSEPYIGHMGLGGVGDSKGLMESELRERHIKWITNAKMTSVTALYHHASA
jgi:sulfide:quinone oxidoreductase